MIADITTVMTKEWREFFASGGSRRTGLIGQFIFIIIFGIYLPYQFGRDWTISTFTVFFYSVYLPLSLVSNIIADAIAGERERHTLETLLASRLSDRAIILGKLGAAVGYSLALSVITALIGMVSANLRGGGSFQPYPAGILVSIVVFALLVSLLFSGIGVLVSLRASTVRQAQQTMGFALIVVFLLPFLVYSTLSASARLQLLNWLSTANWTTVGVLIATGLIVADLIVIAITIVRFQRSRLILS
jgi:ABC-2 type transport system permease protein